APRFLRAAGVCALAAVQRQGQDQRRHDPGKRGGPPGGAGPGRSPDQRLVFSGGEVFRSMALEMGAEFTIDPTITPMMDGKRGVLELNIRQAELQQVLHDETLVGSVEEFCAPPSGPLEEQDATETLPCSAGHTACYVSPYGDVYPCVQFPLPSGNVRQQKFIDIWRD